MSVVENISASRKRRLTAVTSVPPSSPPDNRPADNASQENDISFKIFFPLVDYLQDKYGAPVVAALAAEVNLHSADFKNPHLWVPLSSANIFLEGARAVMENDDEFRRACAYRLKESYGPLRFLLRAASPQTIFALAIKHFPAISKISSGQMTRLSRSRILLTYRSEKKESRLMCISRQAQSVTLPTLWGMPHAHLNEKKCTSWGDDCCEYELNLYHTKSWVPPLLGALVGAAGMAILDFSHVNIMSFGVLSFLLPFIGAVVGYAISLRRMNQKNYVVSEEINEELRKHVRENVEVRSEIEAANRRQREWSKLMEEQVAERTEILDKVVDDINRMQAEQNDAIRGFSHDLKNPFFILSMITESLAMMRGKMDKEAWSLVEEQIEAVTRMRLMLDNLVTAAAKKAGMIRLSAEKMPIAPLVEILRRRLKAFVHGRDIRVSVFSNREAPAEIVTDRLLFDRVLDNLLTNAAKYTTQGSIIVEIDGKPGFLTIKVSDTGRGIDEVNLSRIFIPGGSAPERREQWSHGVGLSVVVRLLAQIGGKLEVMSLPNRGTTFWVHFPVSFGDANDSPVVKPRISKLSSEDLFLSVVRVRKHEKK